MNPSIAIAIGFVLALAFTIFVCIAVLPSGKKQKLSGFMRSLHDLFNFSSLLVEKLLKVLYVFVTGFCIAGGFFLLFGKTSGYFGSSSTFLYGLLLLILGPILARILFECMMVYILILKNTIEINKKMDVIVDSKSEGRNEQGPAVHDYSNDPFTSPVESAPAPKTPDISGEGQGME